MQLLSVKSKYGPGTKLPHIFWAGIGPLQLGVVHVTLFIYIFLPCKYLFGDIDVPTTVSRPQTADCLVGQSSGEC